MLYVKTIFTVKYGLFGAGKWMFIRNLAVVTPLQIGKVNYRL
ncbi:hypothetical protein [Bacillus sp. AFS023182]|nr:hypothetical protein [Bacillus sp. AFS023182]